jgi:hypothetical protein
MHEPWFARPSVNRIQLVGVLLLLVLTETVVIVFFLGARRFHPSQGLSLCVMTFTIVVFGLAVGCVQGYRALGRLRSTLDAGDKSTALILVSRQFFLLTAMAQAGGLTIIASVAFLIWLLRPK